MESFGWSVINAALKRLKLATVTPGATSTLSASSGYSLSSSSAGVRTPFPLASILYMNVCIMYQPGKVVNPARGHQLKNANISLSPFAPENLVSRDGFGSPGPRQPAHLHTQAESGKRRWAHSVFFVTGLL